MHGEAEGRLQDLLSLQPRAQAQVETGHASGQLPGQLRPPAAQEQIHDGQVVGLATGGQQGLGPGPGQAHAIALAAQDGGQGLPAS